MKAEVSLGSLLWNHGLRDYFFRPQAWNTLVALFNCSVMSKEDVMEALENLFDELDELEEFLYSETIDEISKVASIQLEDEYSEAV